MISEEELIEMELSDDELRRQVSEEEDE